MGLPVGVFMVAIAMAFASETKPETPVASEYIKQGLDCRPVNRGCNNVSMVPCTYSGQQVWTDNCTVRLYHFGVD